MALNLLVRYRLITSPQLPDFASGDMVNVYWDDSSEVLEVQHFDSPSDTTGTVITTGPDFGAVDVDFIPVTAVPIPYSFCDGLNLQTFEVRSTFPYVDKISNVNHFSCTSLVCDLQISDDFTIQDASDFVTDDGAIEVTATSSNGDIKFSLDPEFDFSTEGQTSGIFAGLFAGGYTITAKDELGCVDQITVNVPVPDFYNPIYRLEYDAMKGADGAPTTPTRIDILERGYTGSVTEVCASGDPFVLRYTGFNEINKFKSIIASEARLTIESQTNFQFRDLFSEDERKYQIRYYKNLGISADGFTPDTLDGLNLWTNVAGAGLDWTTGATPSIVFDDIDDLEVSDLLYTAYTFEAGREYSFDYTFTKTTTGTVDVMTIRILDASNNTLSLRYVYMKVASISGNFTFVAPYGATGIGIKVDESSLSTTYSVTSFTNQTQSITGTIGGDFELKWLGYIISSNYSEAYLAPPYPVTIVATDGLADLKNYDYLDKDENKYREDQNTLTAITEILAKTDLSINILSAINRYEEDMNQTSNDDPLNQCEFDPETFYHNNSIKNCAEVLEEILKPFGARILQRNGKWCIYSVEEFVTSADYREFDSLGNLLGNGSIDDVVNIDSPIIELRAAFINREQVLAMIPAYGKFFFEHTLLKHESLVASHGFEEDDIFINPDGIVTFKNWNVNIVNCPGAVYGIKKTKSLEGDYNFYVDPAETVDGNFPVNPPVIEGRYIVVSCTPFSIEYSAQDLFEFRFSIAVLLKLSATLRQPLWTRIRWTLKIGSYYYNQESDGWDNSSWFQKNNFFVSSYNNTTEFKVTGSFRDVAEVTTETVEIIFYLEAGNYKDFISFATLKDFDTTTKAIGHRLKGESYPDRLYYILEDSTDAESSPDVIRPDDYAGTTNEKVWRLERIVPPNAELPIKYFYLDNVVLLHFTNGEDTPNNITIQRNNNAGIKVNFEEAYLLNDIDLENINNSERTYKNYFKKLDGTPTQVWERTYRAGSGKLLDLLSNDIVSQYKRGSNKLTGSFITDTEVLPTSVMNEVNDGNKKYMFMGYELHDKTSSIGFDILEVQDTITDPDSDDIAADFNTDFSLDFHS